VPSHLRTRRVAKGLPLALAVLLTACGQTQPGPSPRLDAASLPHSRSSHVVVIAMENKEASDVIGNSAAPYINGLAKRYGLATQSYGVTHPSLPNYLALTSGSTQGVSSDCTACHFAARNLIDQLSGAQISWRAYLEGYPGRCSTTAGVGGYAKKHDPFIYYDDVSRSPQRCRRLVGLPALGGDLRAGRLPTFVWLTPNLCDDTHDCGLGSGDQFLSRWVPALLAELGPHGLLVITWDEGTTDAGCCSGAAAGGRITTVVAGPDVRHGARDAVAVDHYGVLRTIEDALGLPALGAAADRSNGTLRPLFTRPPKVA
jgi:hypothetical protein